MTNAYGEHLSFISWINKVDVRKDKYEGAICRKGV